MSMLSFKIITKISNLVELHLTLQTNALVKTDS